MKQQELVDIRAGFETAYIDNIYSSNVAYKPQFVSNNHKEGKKVIASIEEELLRCDKFQISVAFITMSGIAPLLQTLKELEKKGVEGEILTTNYLDFSEPRALKKLNELKNVTLRMYDGEAADEGFHTRWDSQIGRGIDSSYMQDVVTAKRKHLLVKKSDAESNFYYMGLFDIVNMRADKKKDNRGKVRDITKVKVKMQHAVREDLLRYLQSKVK